MARAVLREGEEIGADRAAVPAFYSASLRNGLAEADLLAAEQSTGTERAEWLKKAGRACRAVLKHGKAFRGGLPEAMRLQGTCEWLRGKPGAAKQWWERSLSVAQEMGQRYDLGRTHLEMGRRLGQTEHLEQAAALFAEIGAEWDLMQAREALGTRAVRMSSGAPSW